MAENISEEEYITSLGIEGVKTKDELVAHVTKLKEDAAAKSDFEAKWTTANTELEAIKPAYETLKSTPPIAPYKSETSKWLDELNEKGLDEEQIEKAWAFRKVDPDKLSPEEVVKTVALIKTPGLRPEHVNAEFKSKYVAPVETDEDTPEEKEAKREQKLLKESNLIGQANTDREFLKTFKLNTTTPKADLQKKQFEDRQVELNTFWGGRAPVVLKDLGTIKGKFALNLPGGKGVVQETVEYEYTVPEKDFGNFITNTVKNAVTSMVPNTQEGEQNLINYAKDRIKSENFDKILEAQQVAINNKVVDFLVREFNVKLPAKQAGSGAGGDGGNDGKESFESATLKFAGKRQGR